MTFIFWLQFATVCVAGAMSPGPSLALIIRNSITINRFAGFMTAVGHGLGMGVYAVFAVTGLSIILTANELLFQLIQIIGILFSGVGKTSSELNFAISKKILLINAESLSEIIEINRIAKLRNKKVLILSYKDF